MDSTYRTLRAAADLGSFTIKALAHTARVSEVTVRTVLKRNSCYFERGTDQQDVTRQRGGQAHAWLVKPERRDALEDLLAERLASLERSQLAVTELSSTGQLTLRSPSPSPELLSADELDKGLLMPEVELLPRLLQRLFAVTKGLSGLTIRSGAGVLVQGYDGVVQSLEGVPPYVPAGPSVWELGAGGDAKKKANSDIRERTTNPRNVVTKRTAFVFVTTRRLPDWTGGKHSASWRKVLVIDADALETWMLSQPAVHIWASEIVGLKPLEISTIEHWFDIWRQHTHPVLPARLLALGRDKEAAKVREVALGTGGDVGIHANSRAEALAFIASTLGTTENLGVEEEYRLRSALLVETPNEWTRLVASLSSGILVPDFPDADVAAAVGKGLTVFVPLGLGDPVRHGDIVLPRIDRVRAAEMLRTEVLLHDVEFGVSEEPMSLQAADQLAAETDQSLTAFRRSHGRSRTSDKAAWATDSRISTWLAPLVLLGSWEPACYGDKEIVSRLVAREYEEVEQQLIALAAAEDPPFFKSGGAWRLSAPADAFEQLGRIITDATSARWAELAVDVLGEYNPVFAVELLDDVPDALPDHLTYSSSLRSGIARGVALLAVFGDEGKSIPNALVRSVVRNMLEPLDIVCWCSAAPTFQSLAEADPDAFLAAVNSALRDPGRPLEAMFRDRGYGGFGGTSPHVYLVWALELLCRSRDHAPAACFALAGLAQVDPGGRNGNRPADSLRKVLLPWSPQLNATVGQRLDIASVILEQYPSVGWQLLIGLLPQLHDWTGSIPEPTFRNWRIGLDNPTDKVYYWQALVSLAISAAGGDPVRLEELVKRLPALGTNERESIVKALEQTDISSYPDAVRTRVWQALHDEVAHHRQFPDAPWRLPDSLLVQLEQVIEAWKPNDRIARSAMYFQRHPQLPLPNLADYENYQRAVEERRIASFSELWQNEAAAGLERLAVEAPEPDTVGWAAASLLGDEVRSLMLGWLPVDTPKSQVAVGWLGHMAANQPNGWVEPFLEELGKRDSATKLAGYRALQDRPETIARISTEDAELQRGFWQSADQRMHWNPNVEGVVRGLVAHGQASSAIHVLGLKLGTDVVTPDLVKSTLDAELAADTDAAPADAMRGFHIGRLLDFLGQNGVDRSQLARLEFSFILVPGIEHQPTSLHSLLGEDPKLFVELVGYLVGRGSDETSSKQVVTVLGHRSYYVLRQWRTPPGSKPGGEIDIDILEEWVYAARELFAQEDLSDLGDEFIGQLLSGVGEGADGIWPSEPVRVVLREVPSDHLRAGISIGRFNARGVTIRDPFDGGQQERSLLEVYASGARKLAARWPETARLLRELADHYRDLANQQDHIADRFRDGR
ncbi:hypothetical protein [Ferrimicrobium sp.]|uniref:hypothetical protein n=1 Tax=Ferrimicrobium sp. TaxID=2926050 RepID=UPI00261695AF|nr:hypothetical protein [Ferrimicrobium sp.]